MLYLFAALGGMTLGATTLLIWFFRNDRNRWQKMYISAVKELSDIRQTLSKEHAEAHQQEIKASYEKGAYDARETDAIYRQLLMKTQKNRKEESQGNIVPFKNNSIN